MTSSLSASTVRRWLAEDAIKPWQHESWIFPRDPDFAAKAARVLDLYGRIWNGRKLGPNDYVISATATDEDGTWAAGNTIPIHVNNVPPTLTLGTVPSAISFLT